MAPSSRTPEGDSGGCPVCGKGFSIEPSAFPRPDACCPHCGSLLWFPSRSCNPYRRGRFAVDHVVKEIHQLAVLRLEPARYYYGLLLRVVGAMDAVAGAVWRDRGLGDFHLTAEVHTTRVGLDLTADRCQGLLHSVICARAPWYMLPRSAVDRMLRSDGQCFEDLPQYLTLAAPIRAQEEVRGVLAVWQSNSRTHLVRGYLQFLGAMSRLAAEYEIQVSAVDK